jgi:hypothetical protein
VETPNYCTQCGAPLTPDKSLYTKWLRPVLVVVGSATVILASLAILVLALVSVLPDYNLIGDGDFCHACTVKFHNTTDETLCAFYTPCGPGNADIKPRGKSEWLLDSCLKSAEVQVFTKSGRELYSKVAGCHEWDDAFILINYRDGEFIIADSLDPPTPP